MNLFGPTKMTSIGSKHYAFVIVDDYYHLTWVIFLPHKNKAFTNFEVFVKRFKQNLGTSLLASILTTEENLKINSLKNSAKTTSLKTSPHPDHHKKMEWVNKKIVLFKILLKPCY